MPGAEPDSAVQEEGGRRDSGAAAGVGEAVSKQNRAGAGKAGAEAAGKTRR